MDIDQKPGSREVLQLDADVPPSREVDIANGEVPSRFHSNTSGLSGNTQTMMVMVSLGGLLQPAPAPGC